MADIYRWCKNKTVLWWNTNAAFSTQKLPRECRIPSEDKSRGLSLGFRCSLPKMYNAPTPWEKLTFQSWLIPFQSLRCPRGAPMGQLLGKPMVSTYKSKEKSLCFLSICLARLVSKYSLRGVFFIDSSPFTIFAYLNDWSILGISGKQFSGAFKATILIISCSNINKQRFYLDKH